MTTLRNVTHKIVMVHKTQATTCNRFEDEPGPEPGESINQVELTNVENGKMLGDGLYLKPTKLDESDIKQKNLHGNDFDPYVKYVGENETDRDCRGL